MISAKIRRRTEDSPNYLPMTKFVDDAILWGVAMGIWICLTNNSTNIIDGPILLDSIKYEEGLL